MKRPNFVIFYTDDQGYGDVGCYGADDFKTPHMDALAASGARFTNWYSNSPVCSPSRASLLTGCYPQRVRIPEILGGRGEPGLMPEYTNLAEALKPLGYRTGVFGKWHLGGSPECVPTARGFDEFFGHIGGCIDYFSHLFVWGQEVPWHDLWRGTEEVWENGEYFTHIITRECKRFLRAQEDGPFFLYVPYNAPHYPMHAPAEYFERFEDLPTVRRHQAAMVAAADDSVGEIMAELDALGLRDDTVVFFQSDNGPSVEKRNFMSMEDEDYYYGGSTGGLRGYKASLFEGGIRMPAWLSWPGRIPAGQTVDEIGLAMDIVPTFLKMAGAEPPEGSIVSPKSNVQLKNDERSATGGTSCTLPDNALERRLEIDGKDILPMAQGKTPSPHEDVFWAYKNQRAVRRGKWKLTLNADIDFRRTCPDRVFLADLESDPGETINLASEHPALTRELKIAIMDWESSVDLSRAV